MRNTIGQNVRLYCERQKTIKNLLNLKSKDSKPLNSIEKDFLDYIKFHGINEFVCSLKLIHDFALYHTDLCFDSEEKKALYNLKILWEGFEQIRQKS